jgi:hypothetical protein
MTYLIMGWILYTLDAPWFVWILLAIAIASEIHAMPLYMRLIRRNK